MKRFLGFVKVAEKSRSGPLGAGFGLVSLAGGFALVFFYGGQ
jgi:hypothetical protein